MSKGCASKAYKSSVDILCYHGLLVFALYWVSEVASWLSLGQWLRNLPRLSSFKCGYDADRDKVLPWWQDIVLGFYLVLTIVAVIVTWHPTASIAYLGSWLAVYVLYDALVFQMRVLWFDDLMPCIPDTRRGVWSHRRILFVAIIGFCQTILLFPSIYRLLPRFATDTRSNLIERSFKIATSLELPDIFTWADVVLVLMALFFLVIVIATTASIAYHRKEIAPKPPGNEAT